MNRILADRVKLLSAMKAACKEMSGSYKESEIKTIEDIILSIRKDVDSFLSISREDKNSVSYSRKGHKARTKTTLARYIRRKLGVTYSQLSDRAVDKLCAIVKRILVAKNLDREITIIKGNDIIQSYRHSKAGSCMTGCECDKVQLYALNPDKVSLILHKDARSLLWKTDEGDYVLDRVYPAQCHSVEIIRSWAKSKGYVLRENPDTVVDTGYFVKLSNGKTLSVTLKHRNIFPYMDTFPYGKYGETEIVVKNDPKFGNMIMHTTSGKYDRAKICMRCDRRVNVGEYTSTNNGELYCYECFDKFFFCCDYCGEHKTTERDGRFILLSSYCLCRGCYENNSFVKACKHCGGKDYHTNLHVTSNNDYYCYDCYVEHLVGCKKCKVRFEKEEMVMDELCKNCFEYDVCGVCENEIKDLTSNIYMENGLIICSSCGCE